jgi:hypothetical protein
MIPLFQKIQKEGPILSKTYANYLHKIQAKTIVQSITKDVKVARLVKTFFKPEELHETDMNPMHILKATRGSGYCLDLGNSTIANARNTIREWSQKLATKNLPVEFLIEEKLNDDVYGYTGNAVDYKFFCFHGKPAYFLCRDGKNRNFYDLHYNPLKLESTAELKPINLEPMIRIAEELSRQFEFVRIDLYNCKDGVYFGEYTFHCREGKQEFDMEREIEFGKLW